MVQLIALYIYKNTGAESKALRLARAKDVSSFGFFVRGTISEHIDFATRTCAQRTQPGQRLSLTLQDNPFLCHTWVRVNGLAGVVVCDKEYPVRVAFALINDMLQDFESKNRDLISQIDRKIAAAKSEEDYKDNGDEQSLALEDSLKKYQNPKEADKLMKIQKELDDVKDIMTKNIEEVLKRGEKLEDLMDRSKDLSDQSTIFYKQAKKANSCCRY